MRLLYANRRLSIQPDSMIVPSTESDDAPLVHDILDRLGLLEGNLKKEEDDPATSAMPIPHANYQTTQKHLSTSSMQSSHFDSSFFDSPSIGTLESPLFNMPTLPEPDVDMLGQPGMDMEMGLSFPYEVYETMNASITTGKPSQVIPKHMIGAQMDQQDWCPLSVLDGVMNAPFPMETWGALGTSQEYSY